MVGAKQCPPPGLSRLPTVDIRDATLLTCPHRSAGPYLHNTPSCSISFSRKDLSTVGVAAVVKECRSGEKSYTLWLQLSVRYREQIASQTDNHVATLLFLFLLPSPEGGEAEQSGVKRGSDSRKSRAEGGTS